MANANGTKSSADIEREVSEQRDRLEARIGEIRERLSPGQLIDEVLSYTKDGGSKFASNLGRQITANPLPAALVGVGLTWLIASNANPGMASQPMQRDDHRYDDEDFPYAKASGSGLKRVSHAADESGQWWSEFETNTGSRYRAASDSLGRRAGHFMDATGKKFAGFIDDSGNRVRRFQDESGNALDQTMGWASHRWSDLSRQAQGLASSVAQMGGDLTAGARDLAGTVRSTARDQTSQLSRQVADLFEQQPLIAGALAFAAGAAMGAVLPSTSQEDQLIGEQADKVRRKATRAAGRLYEQGKEQSAQVYEDVTDKAGQLYSETKDKVADVAARPSGTTNLH